MFINMIGILAGILTTIAFLPQVIRTYKTRSVKDISLGMFSIMFTGVILWLIYGLLKADLPIILANGITLFLVGIILIFKLRFHSL